MMCLKLYSDTTDLQNLLRRAHWTVTPKEIRQMYYHWAVGLYEAHLYHAKPIPASKGAHQPSKLYHGLNRVFMLNTELPVYNGPFSTTIAKLVARTFCKDQGLLFVIQSSYANPLKLCIGIVMDWISGFKHEREVLLYNQFLPIQKTEMFDDDSMILMKHFLYSLFNRELKIVKKEAFYNQLGVSFEPNWIPQIIGHHLLFKETKSIQSAKLIDRLSDELDIAFFKLLMMARSSMMINAENEIVFVEDSRMKTVEISEFVFCVNSGHNMTEMRDELDFHQFETNSEFNIPLHSVMQSMRGFLSITLFCKAVNDSFDFVPIQRIVLPRYCVERSSPVVIKDSVKVPPFNQRLGQNGCIQIKSTSDIIIAETAAIKSVETWKDRGGGEIRIVSSDSIINNGTLCCNGHHLKRGGAIYIVADSFINNGRMESVENGSIHIFCREYTNNGVMIPEPTIHYIEPSVFDVDWMKNWSLTMAIQCETDEIVLPFLNIDTLSDAVKHCGSEVIQKMHRYLMDRMSATEVHRVYDMVNGKEDENGCSLFHFACMAGQEQIARYLVDTVGIDVLRKDNDAKTGLHYALQNGHESMVKWFIPQISGISPRSNDQVTRRTLQGGEQRRFLLTDMQNEVLSSAQFMSKMIQDFLHFGTLNVDGDELVLESLQRSRTAHACQKLELRLGALWTREEIAQCMIEMKVSADDILSQTEMIKFLNSMVQSVSSGGGFRKHQKNGKAAHRWVVIDKDRLYWKENAAAGNQKKRSLNIAKIVAILEGKQTTALKNATDVDDTCCFSIDVIISKKNATLDLSGENEDMVRMWIVYLKAYNRHFKQQMNEAARNPLNQSDPPNNNNSEQ